MRLRNLPRASRAALRARARPPRINCALTVRIAHKHRQERQRLVHLLDRIYAGLFVKPSGPSLVHAVNLALMLRSSKKTFGY
jgi:hypothetical protein